MRYLIMKDKDVLYFGFDSCEAALIFERNPGAEATGMEDFATPDDLRNYFEEYEEEEEEEEEELPPYVVKTLDVVFDALDEIGVIEKAKNMVQNFQSVGIKVAQTAGEKLTLVGNLLKKIK